MTVPPSASTSKRRSSPRTLSGAPAGGVPPSTNVAAAPAPLMVRLSVMSRSPVVTSFWFSGGIAELVRAGRKLDESAPASAFVSWTAARSVHVPALVRHEAVADVRVDRVGRARHGEAHARGRQRGRLEAYGNGEQDRESGGREQRPGPDAVCRGRLVGRRGSRRSAW